MSQNLFSSFSTGKYTSASKSSKEKKRLHLFSSVSVTQVSVIYSIFIIFRPILQEVLPVEQQAFSHHFLSIIQLSVGLTDIVLYINCLWPTFVTIVI